MNLRPGDLCGASSSSLNTDSWLTCPLSREQSGPEFHCLEQSLGSGVSVGANCLFGLAWVASLASWHLAPSSGNQTSSITGFRSVAMSLVPLM